MKIAYFWTADFSANILSSLIRDYKQDIEIELVVSQADKPVWRKQQLEKTPVKQVAEENNLDILQPEKLKDNFSFEEKLKSLELDFIVVVAYGKIIPKSILEIPKFGCINIHWSILPAYRWASPVQESIKNGDVETGLTIMYMSEKMDEWDILAIEKVDINILDKSPDIFTKFEEFWADLLVETLKWVLSWDIKWQKQDEQKVSYCSKISKVDWEINWQEETVEQIYDKFRAYYTWPGIYTYYKWKKLDIIDCFYNDIDLSDDDELSIWEVVEIEDEHWWKNKEIWVICKWWILVLKQLKLEWKNKIDIFSFINGNKDFLDYKF